MDLKESSVRDWKKLYEQKLNRKCSEASSRKLQDVAVKELPRKKCGWPPLLGEKLDGYLQDLILAMRSQGSAINTNIVVSVGRGILLKHRKSDHTGFGGSVNLNKEWARSVLKRMGFSKRRASSKTKVVPIDCADIQKQYLSDIKPW